MGILAVTATIALVMGADGKLTEVVVCPDPIIKNGMMVYTLPPCKVEDLQGDDKPTLEPVVPPVVQQDKDKRKDKSVSKEPDDHESDEDDDADEHETEDTD